MLSSITSMMHQFYFEQRKHWQLVEWMNDVTLMFHPCFRCFSTLKPAIFRLLNINDSSMKRRWIAGEEFTCFPAEFKVIKLRNLQMSLFPIKLSESIELKSERSIFWTLSEKKLPEILKNDFMRTEEHFGQFVFRKSITTCPEKLLGQFFAKYTWLWKLFGHWLSCIS